jgi:hypothetical protein
VARFISFTAHCGGTEKAKQMMRASHSSKSFFCSGSEDLNPSKRFYVLTNNCRSAENLAIRSAPADEPVDEL